MVIYGRDPCSCLQYPMLWYSLQIPLAPYKHSVVNYLVFAGMATSSSLEISLTRAAQVKQPVGEAELINPARHQHHITFLTWAMVLHIDICVLPPSQQIRGISLRWSNVSRHGCIPCMQMMTEGATPNDWPRLPWLGQGDLPKTTAGNQELTADTGETQPWFHWAQGSLMCQAVIHMFKGKQGMELLIVSVTSASFLLLLS